MNTHQMLVKLFTGSEITNDDWDAGGYIYMSNHILYDELDVEVDVFDFITLLYYANNKGFHLYKKSKVKKPSTKDIKVGDVVAENSSCHPQFKVKYLDEDWVFLIPISSFSGSRDSISFRFDDWKDCTYKEFSFPKVKAEE